MHHSSLAYVADITCLQLKDAPYNSCTEPGLPSLLVGTI